MARAGELGVDQALSFLREVDAINLRRRARMVDLARELCGGTLAGVRVADPRCRVQAEHRRHPRLARARRRPSSIQRAGAAVRVYDPQAMDNARVAYPTLAYARVAVEAARDADVVLHLTEWAEFRRDGPVRPVRRRAASAGSWTGATRSIANAGAPTGGSYRALGRT